MISEIPKARAKDRSPRDVSNTILDVITLVTWAMLPPTIIIAPTSDNALPSPAMPFTVNSCLDSHISVFAILEEDASIDELSENNVESQSAEELEDIKESIMETNDNEVSNTISENQDDQSS